MSPSALRKSSRPKEFLESAYSKGSWRHLSVSERCTKKYIDENIKRAIRVHRMSGLGWIIRGRSSMAEFSMFPNLTRNEES